jgi:hypothetical protein
VRVLPLLTCIGTPADFCSTSLTVSPRSWRQGSRSAQCTVVKDQAASGAAKQRQLEASLGMVRDDPCEALILQRAQPSGTVELMQAGVL